jgi:hypothetical protein
MTQLGRHPVRSIGFAFGAMSMIPVGAAAQQGDWNKLPRMQLERQFAGPLQDTIIQRWRDPVDGMICYIYLPITAAHTPPTPTGYVQYGANTIGGISCLESTHTGTVPQAHAAKPAIAVPHAPKPPAAPAPPAQH